MRLHNARAGGLIPIAEEFAYARTTVFDESVEALAAAASSEMGVC